ncbi:MAG: hypothetical protein QGG54_00360 [Gammaproteobacteria bacterium]|nr:hypothetical protein [Gammaproteobacteria bacterium]
MSSSEKKRQFERLWKGETPKGTNPQKRDEFRSKMKSSCQQLGLRFSKINSQRIYLGETGANDDEITRVGEVRVRHPPRRHLRGH